MKRKHSAKAKNTQEDTQTDEKLSKKPTLCERYISFDKAFLEKTDILYFYKISFPLGDLIDPFVTCERLSKRWCSKTSFFKDARCKLIINEANNVTGKRVANTDKENPSKYGPFLDMRSIFTKDFSCLEKRKACIVQIIEKLYDTKINHDVLSPLLKSADNSPSSTSSSNLTSTNNNQISIGSTSSILKHSSSPLHSRHNNLSNSATETHLSITSQATNNKVIKHNSLTPNSLSTK